MELAPVKKGVWNVAAVGVGRMTQDALVKRELRPDWLVISTAMLLVLGSSLHKFPISLGVANVYLPQILALAIFPLLFYRDAKTALMRAAVSGFLALSAIATVFSFLLPSADVRLSFLLQIFLNSFTMIVSFALFRHLSKNDLKIVILACGAILSIGTVLQLVLAPGMNNRGEKTLGLVHPILFFTEETWLALFAALLSVAAFGMNCRKMGLALTVIAFFIGTRSAMIISGAALLMSFSTLAGRKWIRVLIVLFPAIFALWFTADSIFGMSRRVFNDTLDTRAYDIHAVRQANHDVFFPFGGDVLSVFDYSRSRQVPATSNVQAFELIWKFGLGGLLILLAFTLLISWLLPKLLVVKPEGRIWPVWSGLMIWPAMLQFNNSFGYSWMWVLLALLLAVMATGDSQSSQSEASSTIKS